MQRQSGFSLLEVLVAFSILALSLGVVLQIFSTGVRGVTQSGNYGKAMLLAESKMAAAGRDEELGEGEYSGDFNDTYRWRVVMAPYETEELDPDKFGLDAFRVEVEVEWEDGERRRRVSLTSLRLLRRNG